MASLPCDLESKTLEFQVLPDLALKESRLQYELAVAWKDVEGKNTTLALFVQVVKQVSSIRGDLLKSLSTVMNAWEHLVNQEALARLPKIYAGFLKDREKTIDGD